MNKYTPTWDIEVSGKTLNVFGKNTTLKLTNDSQGFTQLVNQISIDSLCIIEAKTKNYKDLVYFLEQNNIAVATILPLAI